MKTFIFLLLISVNALSDSLTPEYGIYAAHLVDFEHIEPNEDNNLIGIEYGTGNWYINASTFDNTYNNRAYTFGSGYKLLTGYNIDLDVLWGIVHGYKPGDIKSLCTGKTCLYVAPRLSYHLFLSDSFSIKPSVKLFGPAVEVGVGAECRF
jgi:hypothetical protein